MLLFMGGDLRSNSRHHRDLRADPDDIAEAPVRAFLKVDVDHSMRHTDDRVG